MKKILIIGADSAIAQAVAKEFAKDKPRFFLGAYDKEKLDLIAGDLKARGAESVDIASFDALDTASHAELLRKALSSLQEIDVAFIAYGTLPDQEACQASFEAAEREIRLNFISVVSLLTILANRMEEAGKSTIAVISSPAGDRGRQSNYVYGAAKGGLTVFLGGLRNRLAKKGVHVLTIKPGFVSTPMTAHLKQGPLFVQPERVAADIYRAIERQKNVLYTPWFWKYIMFIIRHIPESIFKKLKL